LDVFFFIAKAVFVSDGIVALAH